MTNSATVTAFKPRAVTIETLTRLTTSLGTCRDVEDIDGTYFPDHDVTPKQADEACAGCPVRDECLKLALLTRSDHGIFGGTTPEQRAAMLGQAVA